MRAVDTTPKRTPSKRWAELIYRIYEVDLWTAPAVGQGCNFRFTPDFVSISFLASDLGADAALVRLVQSSGGLGPIAKDLLDRQRAALQSLREALSFKVLHHQIVDAVLLADS